jgi:hypothetical protein
MAYKDDGGSDGAGKAIDLGDKLGAEIKPKTGRSRYYPTLHISGLKAGSYFVEKGAGADCSGLVEFKVKSLSESDDGTFSVTLEARKLTPS